MASCELKQTLEVLKKEQRELLNQAKNEVVLSEIVLSDVALSDAEKSMLESILGKDIAKKAMAIHDMHIADEDINAAIVEMKSAMDADSNAALKVRHLSLKVPEAKYNAIDLTLAPIKDGSMTIQNYIRTAVGKIIGSEKAEKRQKKLADQFAAAREASAAARGTDEHGKLVKAESAAAAKFTGKSIADSIRKVPKIISNDESLFPKIFPTTNSYANKGSDNVVGGTDEGVLKTAAVVAKEVSEHGYSSNDIKNLVVRYNTLDSEHEVKDSNSQNHSSDYKDELSPLAMLFGMSKLKDGKTNVVEIPDYVKNSIKINALDHMEDVYKMLAYEAGSKEFNDIWGLDLSSKSYDEDLEIITEAHSSGKIPQATILTSLGKSIYRSLPVNFSAELDSELSQRAIAQLGMYALRYMHEANLISIDENKTDINDKTKSHILIQANNGSNKESLLVSGRDIMNLISELQYLGVGSDRHAPRAIGEEHEVSQTIRNSFLETSEEVKTNLKAYESTRFRFNDHMKTVYDLYMNGEDGPENAYAFAGVLSVDESKNRSEQMKEMSKINYAKMQIDAMIKVYERFHIDGKNEEFTLPYDYTVSGRYMINSMFNPQESKISRFLVTSKDLDSTIGIAKDGSLDKGDMDVFKVGLAQSFDLDPDKTTDINAIEKLEEIVSIDSHGHVTFKKEYGGKPNPFKILYDMLGNGSLSGDISPEMRIAMMNVNRAGSGFHAVQAIMALKQLNDAAKKGISEPLTLSFSLESDAITSGMILTLMQIGTPHALALAAKGGVYTEETIAHWDKMYKIYYSLGGNNFSGGKLIALEQDGKFKLTHGWLKEFSKSFTELVNKEDGKFLNDAYNKLSKEDQAKAQDLDGKYKGDIKAFMLDQVDFSDFYETVSKKANKLMKEMAIKNSEKLKELAVEIAKETDANKKAELIKEKKELDKTVVLMELVGDVSRKLAKPSVMVYIYGAMMNSIKKKMLDAIVLPKIYDIFMLPTIAQLNYDTISSLLASEKGIATLTKAIQDDLVKHKKMSSEDAVKKANTYLSTVAILLSGKPKLDFKKLENGSFARDDKKLLGNIIIPDKAASVFMKATNETLGVSFEEGFSEFDEIDAFRDAVKSAEVVRFTMFKYKLGQGLTKIVNRMKGDGDYKISSRDVATVINELENSGFGHSVNDINGGKQPLYNKSDLEKKVRTILALNVKKLTGGYMLPSAAIEGKEFSPNTGASGVITVHNIDGFIDAVSARAFDLIRIYDGSVSGINRLNESVEVYNKTVLDTTSWNSYNKQVNDLAKQISILTEKGEMQDMLSTMSDNDKEVLLNTVEKLMGYNDITDEFNAKERTDLKKSTAQMRYASNMSERRNGTRKLAIMHSYLTDSAKLHIGTMNSGSDMAIEDGALDSVYDLYTDILVTLQAYKLAKTVTDSDSATVWSSAISGINISTKSNDALGVALTNVHYGNKGDSAYPITPSITGLTAPKDAPAKKWFGKNYTETPYNVFGNSVEAWYKSNNSEAKGMKQGDAADKYDSALMTSLIADKLTQYPDLVGQINSKGGEAFLRASTHNVTASGSRWETNNGKNLFIEALVAAYLQVSKSEKKIEATTVSTNVAAPASEYTNHSGGAYGADTLWGVIGKEFGVKSNHYKSEKDNRVSATLKKDGQSATTLTDAQIKEGIPMAKKAAEMLGKAWSQNITTQLLLARNWFQVKNSDAVYAVAQLDGQFVKGGTGYAVAMAIASGKSVFAFDPVKNSWYEHIDSSWNKLESAPALTPNFAGIGTRDVEQYNQLDKASNTWIPRKEYLGDKAVANAKKAIRDSYEKTLSSKATLPPSKVLNSGSSNELKWFSSEKNVIVNAKGDTNFKINSIDELIDISEQFHKLMVDRHGLDLIDGSGDFSKHVAWYKDLIAGMVNSGIEFKPLTIKFHEKVTHNGKEVHATMGYDSGIMNVSTNKVYRAYPIKVIAHEYAHAITASGLKANPILAARVTAIMEKAKLAGIDKNPTTKYAFTNEYEFLAEVMSNPTLQNELAKIESIGNSGIEALKKIFNYLLKRINAKEVNSLLHDTLQVVLDVNKYTSVDYMKDINDFSEFVVSYGEWMNDAIANRKVSHANGIKLMEAFSSSMEIVHLAKGSDLKSAATKAAEYKKALVDLKDNINTNGNSDTSEYSSFEHMVKSLADKELMSVYNYATEKEKALIDKLWVNGFKPLVVSSTSQSESYESGQYYSVSNSIGLNYKSLAEEPKRLSVQTLIHELVHANTKVKLIMDGEQSKNSKELQNILGWLRGYYSSKHNIESSSYNDPEYYFLTDIDELIAEAFSNPDVMKKLNSIKVANGKNVSWLRELYTAVVRYLNLSEAEENSALEAIYALTSSMITKDNTPPMIVDPVVAPTAVPAAKAPVSATPSTNKYELFKGVYANGDQENAIDKIKEFFDGRKEAFLLLGRGGTGKTTIIGKVIKELYLRSSEVVFLTPTHKARKILQAANKNAGQNSKVRTIASALGIRKDAKTGKFMQKVKPSINESVKLIVVDESSMVGSFNKALLESTASGMGIKIIYMGDNVQLPPVNDRGIDGKAINPLKESAVFSELIGNSYAKLNERMRQSSESPILPVTDVVANEVESNGSFIGLKLDGKTTFDSSKNEGVIYSNENQNILIDEFIEDYKKDPMNTRWINYNNYEHKDTVGLVASIRAKIFGREVAFNNDFIKGEQVFFTSKFGEDFDNGDEFQIEEMSKPQDSIINYKVWDDNARRILEKSIVLNVTHLKLKDQINGEIHERIPMLTSDGVDKLNATSFSAKEKGAVKEAVASLSYAYVINAHKAQGSTYRNVYLDYSNIAANAGRDQDTGLKALYVATSRPSKKLVIMGYKNDDTNIDSKPEEAIATDITASNGAITMDKFSIDDADYIFGTNEGSEEDYYPFDDNSSLSDAELSILNSDVLTQAQKDIMLEDIRNCKL